MIVSVTPNTTLDQVVFVPSFKPNTTIRASKSFQGLGGKPTDASWILGEMGVPSLALGFAAGAIGRKVESLLRAKGVTPDFIEVNGETRVNVVLIVEDTGAQTTITTTSMQVTPEHIAALRTRYEQALEDATVVVMGGTLPAGMDASFYVDLIGMARAREIPAVFDASEPNLRIGVQASPAFIKPNRDELEQLTGRKINTLSEAYQAGRAILQQYGTASVITLGGDGGLAVLPKRAYRIPPLKVDVVSAGGAGDAVLAGVTWALGMKQPIEDGLRLGFAAATATLLMPGTADLRRADVERFLPKVRLMPYP